MNNLYIKFSVIHQTITRTDVNELVNGSQNYVKARFSFSSDWEGSAKTAVFKGTSTYNVLLDGNGECLVPAEVLANKGTFTVSVFGGALITVNTVKVTVSQSGYEVGSAPTPPPTDIYNQIMEELGAIREEADRDAIIAKVNTYLDSLDIVTEQNVREITEGVVGEYFYEHRSEFKGDKGDKGDPGAQGPKGERGAKGETGPQGIQGETGPQGPKGDTGIQGPKGEKGDVGERGEKGDQGERGIQGVKGDQGIQGPKGDKGDQGLQGLQGERGEQGIPGVKGEKGDTGSKGEKGDTGMAGIVVTETEPTTPVKPVWVNPLGSVEDVLTPIIETVFDSHKSEFVGLPMVGEVNENWDKWKEVGYPNGFDKTKAKEWRMMQGALKNDGTIIVQCSDDTRWHHLNFSEGGHILEGWDSEKKNRMTLLVLDSNESNVASGSYYGADGLGRVAMQCFTIDTSQDRFGWVKIGSDSKYDYRGGWEFNEQMVKAHTPVAYQPQGMPLQMPSLSKRYYNAIPNGTFFVDKQGLPHFMVDGKWHKVPLVIDDDYNFMDADNVDISTISVNDFSNGGFMKDWHFAYEKDNGCVCSTKKYTVEVGTTYTFTLPCTMTIISFDENGQCISKSGSDVGNGGTFVPTTSTIMLTSKNKFDLDTFKNGTVSVSGGTEQPQPPTPSEPSEPSVPSSSGTIDMSKLDLSWTYNGNDKHIDAQFIAEYDAEKYPYWAIGWSTQKNGNITLVLSNTPTTRNNPKGTALNNGDLGYIYCVTKDALSVNAFAGLGEKVNQPYTSSVTATGYTVLYANHDIYEKESNTLMFAQNYFE